jgi:hypothetical protein
VSTRGELTLALAVDLLELVKVGERAGTVALLLGGSVVGRRAAGNGHTGAAGVAATASSTTVATATDDNGEAILVDKRTGAVSLGARCEEERVEVVVARQARVGVGLYDGEGRAEGSILCLKEGKTGRLLGAVRSERNVLGAVVGHDAGD